MSKWLLAVVNVPFYCSLTGGQYNCETSIYRIKPFDDLFEWSMVNLVISSAKNYYEAVRYVFNYQVFNDKSRQFLIAGAAGSKEPLGNEKTKATPLNYGIIKGQKGLVKLSIFETYFKTTFVEVLSQQDLDVHYTEKWAVNTDWIYLLVGLAVITVLLFIHRFVSGEKLGKYFARKKFERDEAKKKEKALLKPGDKSKGREERIAKD